MNQTRHEGPFGKSLGQCIIVSMLIQEKLNAFNLNSSLSLYTSEKLNCFVRGGKSNTNEVYYKSTVRPEIEILVFGEGMWLP